MTGVTIIKIDEKLDHGPIIASEKLEIKNENYEELHDKLANAGAELLVKILPDYLAEKINPAPQDHSKATITKLIKTEDGEITPDETPETAYNKIRALNPEPGTFVFIKDKRLKILEAELAPQPDNKIKAGCLFDAGGKLGLRLQDGSLILKKIQPEGKKPMSGEEFIRGYANFF